MKLAIMQPYWFPYLGYFQLLAGVDKFVVYDDVNYITRGWINRNRILVSGKPAYINLVALAASQNKKICDVVVSAESRWRDKLLSTLNHTYAKAPFKAAVVELVSSSLDSKGGVSDYALNSLLLVLDYLGVEVPEIVLSSSYSNSGLSGSERILDICDLEGCSHYINPVGGMELYDSLDFNQADIALSFIKSHLPVYEQKAKEFVPGLSMIDVLMMNSPEKVVEMLGQYELISY